MCIVEFSAKFLRRGQIDRFKSEDCLSGSASLLLIVGELGIDRLSDQYCNGGATRSGDLIESSATVRIDQDLQSFGVHAHNAHANR